MFKFHVDGKCILTVSIHRRSCPSRLLICKQSFTCIGTRTRLWCSAKMAGSMNGDTLFPQMAMDPISDTSFLNTPLPGLTEIGWQPSQNRITVSTADVDFRGRQQSQRRNRHYGPTYTFSVTQKPFVLSSFTAPCSASSASSIQCKVNNRLHTECLTNADSERSVAIDLNSLTLPPAATPDLANIFPSGPAGDFNSRAHSPSLQKHMYGPSAALTEKLPNLDGISRHFASPQVSPGAGCIQPDVTEGENCNVVLHTDQVETPKINEVDLYCHEELDEDDDLFHLLGGALSGSTLSTKRADDRDATILKTNANTADMDSIVKEGKGRPSCRVWRKLRQSKVVAKWWWHLSTEHWRGRSEGGIYINGELTCAKQLSGKLEPDESTSGKTGQCDKEDKSTVDDRRKPSRFCHICLRRAERVTAVACRNLCTGRCRKVICKRCFDEYNWDWRQAIATGSRWDCPHCRKEFVVDYHLLPFIYLFTSMVELHTPRLCDAQSSACSNPCGLIVFGLQFSMNRSEV